MENDRNRQVHFYAGDSIDKAFERIYFYSRWFKCKAYGFFNGKKISSDDTIDDIYVKVTGVTKKEHEKKEKEYFDKCKKEKEKHVGNIPDLTKKYREKAKSIVKETKLDLWEEIVPIRLNDLYRGMELKATLEIGELLNGGKYSEADKLFREQGHSGLSHSLVCSMLKEFIKNGEDFVERYYKD